jgi:hypothetical protein
MLFGMTLRERIGTQKDMQGNGFHILSCTTTALTGWSGGTAKSNDADLNP